jgi:hypothetical protein
VYYNKVIYALGEELGIPGFELIVSAGLPPFGNLLGGKFDAQRDRVRFFGRYAPSIIHDWIASDINQDEDLRSKCLDWFKERAPASWTCDDITNAIDALADMKRENKGTGEIRQALLNYGIQVSPEQSAEEAIDAQRREEYIAAEVSEIVDNKPRIKLQSIYKMLEDLHVLQKVSEPCFVRRKK